MKQWPVIVVVAGTLASQEIKHQDADLHTHQETQGGMDQPNRSCSLRGSGDHGDYETLCNPDGRQRISASSPGWVVLRPATNATHSAGVVSHQIAISPQERRTVFCSV